MRKHKSKEYQNSPPNQNSSDTQVSPTQQNIGHDQVKQESPEGQNKFQNALQKLRSLKNTSKNFHSEEHDHPFKTSSQNESPEAQIQQKSPFNDPKSNKNAQQEESKGLSVPSPQNSRTAHVSFQRWVSRALHMDPKVATLSAGLNLPEQSQHDKLTEKGREKRRSFLAQHDHQVNFELQMEEIQKQERNLNLPQKNQQTKKRDALQKEPSYETENDSESSHSSAIRLREESKEEVRQRPSQSPSDVRISIGRPSLPLLAVGNLGGANTTKSIAKNPFLDEQPGQHDPQRNIALKYCAPIYLYFEGDLKNHFHIHSESPVKNKVEISHKPPPQRKELTGEQTQRWQLDELPDWQCAPAIKLQGDVFRLIPAFDFHHLEKIQKILKTKKYLEPLNQFKYGEYIESLNEEIKFNLDSFQELKNEFVKFGNSVMVIHENSQLFLKISSPSMSDQQFQFKLKLTSEISEKTVFKLLPSNKIQTEGDGKITENDQFFLAYTYDKILNKDLYLYSDPSVLERMVNKKQSAFTRYNPNYPEMIFTEDRKLPLHFGICNNLDFERSDNMFRHLNGKVIQIKHIESDLLLTMTIKRKENRILSTFFGDKNRYSLNQLIETVPEVYGGKQTTINIHFEHRDSINTYWKVYASPFQKDIIYLENAVSKIRIKPLHLMMINKSGQAHDSDTESGTYYKIFSEEQASNPLLAGRPSTFENQVERKFLWVEYLKFIKAENKYEFSKFGKMNEEDKGSLFDSFKIVPISIYKQHALEFVGNTFKALKSFDYYQADDEKSTEYENLFRTLKKIKQFLRNKLPNLINVDEEYGTPSQDNQNLIKESFILDELVDMMDNIWPDEQYMKRDFPCAYNNEQCDMDNQDDDDDLSVGSSSLSQNENIHKEIKMKIAEKIFEILYVVSFNNLPIQEYVFFEVVPNIQKFFGIGMRRQQDYELFSYLVKECDKYADYKEKTKYNIIFQFIKKLFVRLQSLIICQKQNTTEVKMQIFQLLRNFCINSKEEPNNYHQKLLHDLFFFNQLEGIKFSMIEKRGSVVRSTFRQSNVGDTIAQRSVEKIQRDLKDIEDQKQSNAGYNKSKSLTFNEEMKRTSPKKVTIQSSRPHLETIKEIKIDFSDMKDTEERLPKKEIGNLMSFQTVTDKQRKSNAKDIIPKENDEGIKEEDKSDSSLTNELEEDDIVEVQYQTVDDNNEFIIKSIHDLTFDKLDEKFLLQNCQDTELMKMQLYFFADLCYHMNFDCQCSNFTQKTVANLLSILGKKNSKLSLDVKAGLARVLNTILRNNNTTLNSRPQYLRMYEKQTFQKPQDQPIIDGKDVRALVKLTREHFKSLSTSKDDNLTDYDYEIIRLTSQVIQTNMVFNKDFNEGYFYVQDIFDNIARMHLRSLKVEKDANKSSVLSNSSAYVKNEGTLNRDEFEKQFKKMKKILQSQLQEGTQGMLENPLAWKMLNIEKGYVSLVEKVLADNNDGSFAKSNTRKHNEKQEKARIEMVKFFHWVLNLRIDHLISNMINMFYSSLESTILKEDGNLDSLINNPEKYFTFSYFQRLSLDFINQINQEGSGFNFFDALMKSNDVGNDKNQHDLDIEAMYQSFLKSAEQNQEQGKKLGSPSKQHSVTEPDEHQDKLITQRSEDRKFEQLTFRKKLTKQQSINDQPRKKTLTFENVDEIQEEESLIEKENKIAKQGERKSFNALISPFKKKESKNTILKAVDVQDQQKTEQTMMLAQKQQFLDLLIDLFVYAQNPQLQQEIIKAMFRYLNMKREFLQNFTNTIVVFRLNVKQKIENIKQTLTNSRMIIQDSTIWELPFEHKQDDRKVLSQAGESILTDLNHITDSFVQLSKTKSSKYSKKQEYAKQLKEHQKNQQQLIQQLAFTKSNKTDHEKLFQIDSFIKQLEDISDFFTPFMIKKPLKHSLSRISGNESTQIFTSSIFKDEDELKQTAEDFLQTQLGFIQIDLQYSFLAISGHDIILDFMRRNRDLRQECVRILFYNQKPFHGHMFSEEQQNDQRIIFSLKVLIAFKKCFEILIKFIYNNKTTKQQAYNLYSYRIMLSHIDDLLLFNSEYYMQSKMSEKITLFDFDLINHIIEGNAKITTLSTILTPKITGLVSYIHKIIEFPKKPFDFAPIILKVYSNIISTCDSTKVNDLVIDLILKEESFFQIQDLLLENPQRKKNFGIYEQYLITERFLKGISQILKTHNLRMIKKKFYQIFSKRENLELYFKHLKDLFNMNVERVQQKIQSKQIAEIPDNQSIVSGSVQDLDKKTSIVVGSQSASLMAKIEEEIIELSKKFLVIESYLIHIFYRLFFEIKGSQKQLFEKVEEMRQFIDKREKDMDIVENYASIFDVEQWPQYIEFNEQIELCRRFCIKNAAKNNALLSKLNREGSKISYQSHSSFILKQAASMNFTSRTNEAKMSQLKKFQDTQKTQKDGSSSDDKTSLNNLSMLSAKTGETKKEPLLKRKMTKVLSAISQTQIAQKKEQIFKIFKWNVLHDDNLKSELKKEINCFSEILLKKFKVADEKSSEVEGQKYFHFFTKLVEYSQQSTSQSKERLTDAKVLVEIFSYFIDLTNEGQSYKGEGFEAKTMIQEKLYQIGAVQLVLEMMCSQDNEYIDEIFPYLLCFANRILDGAQNNIQDYFTDYLTKNQSSINLFERCYHLIEKEIQLLQKMNHEKQESDAYSRDYGMDTSPSGKGRTNERKGNVFSDKVQKAYSKEINVQKQILKFLKNLCENHNTRMQLLIGNQGHPEKNFDMVSLTVNYLHSLISNINLSKRNYSNAQNCCISLAEYVQGPCFVNQNRIKDANFYQIAIQILSIKPNLLQDIKNTETNQGDDSPKKKVKLASQQTMTGFNLFKIENNGRENQTTKSFMLSNFMIQKLKLNCTIILLSLLEQRSADDPLLLSMKRSIPLEIIKQNIIYEYFLFCKDYNKFLSRENFFRHVLTQSDDQIKEELIIEVGFNLYFLLKRWSENKKTNDSHLDELMNIIQSEQTQVNVFVGTFRRFIDFTHYMASNVKHLIKKISKRKRTQDNMHKRSRLEKFASQNQNLSEALMFFKNNSASIDVLIKNGIEQVHFPYMPYCTYLTDEEKTEFYNSLPTDRDKEKIEVLVDTSTDLIRRMKIEYQFKKFFINYPLIGALVYHTELWKTLAFYTILILNIMNLYSYTAENDNDRLYQPKLFGQLSTEQTDVLYNFFGFFQMIFAIFIDVTVISKRAIYHYQLIFQDKKSQEEGNNDDSKLSTTQMIKCSFEYMMSAFSDFQLLYYLGYLIFSFIGYLYHPFFYCYHMIDMIIRNPYLRNVLKAIYRPRYELFNTFILFLCMQYIFSMIAYIFFYEDFDKGECTSLSQCFLVIIDQTFKNDGGVGNFLNKAYPEDMPKGAGVNIKRFFFDNFFNVILVILVVEIISGIIIDTFGALREEHNKITDSIENKCMICGKNRDQIEKEYQDMLAQDDAAINMNKLTDEKAFEVHKRDRHNIYDYIFFLAYLQEKPELEYTGLESYVFEKYSETNNTWFPIYKVGSDKQKQSVVHEESDDDSDGNDSQNNDDSDNDNDDNQGSHEKPTVNQKQVMECLANMNGKIDMIYEALGLNMEFGDEEVDRTTGRFNRMNSMRGGQGYMRQNSSVQNQRSTVAGNITIGALPSPNLLAPSNRGPGLSRQGTNSFTKQKSKLQAVNTFSSK